MGLSRYHSASHTQYECRLGAGGNKFSVDYQGVLSALQPASERFQDTVDPVCYKAWAETRDKQEAGPTGHDFQVWPLGCELCSAKARQGAIALNRDNLDPIFVAMNNAMPYRPGTEPITFSIGYSDIVELLLKAPSRKFNVAQGTWNTDVSKS
ncbi:MULTISPECIES: hypothetical protein [Bradyrhizobium]|uniref:hypothetical protein n=1 Tax=Bradyrhizobium TaxID=374 RepID=UPI00114CB3E0|nr:MULTISPECIES: hypothetical protein [Bradyrhizobium]MCA1544874.1 hypothetical protein [Bradyrhizobium sp. NBAIM32]